MFYVNFDDHITAKTGVIMEGWPLPKFCNPSEINSTTELRVLCNAWKNGTARFQKMNQEEWERWDTNRLQRTPAVTPPVSGENHDEQPGGV